MSDAKIIIPGVNDHPEAIEDLCRLAQMDDPITRMTAESRLREILQLYPQHLDDTALTAITYIKNRDIRRMAYRLLQQRLD